MIRLAFLLYRSDGSLHGTLFDMLYAGFRWFLKNVFNRLTLVWAGKAGSPFALVEHFGRRSGKRYKTPIMVEPLGDGFVFELTYGPNVDWYRNVVVAKGCTLAWHGKKYQLSAPEPLDFKTGRAAFPAPARLILRLLNRRNFVRLKIVSQALP